MSPQPVFSIILPIYNSEKYISNILNSIRKQTFKQFELIVIDNLSSDNSIQIINQFADQFCVKIISEKDAGIYDAMNKGVKNAHGDWLYFMGADDTLVNENVLMDVSKYLNEEFDIVYGDSIWIPENYLEKGEWTSAKLIVQSINHQRIFYRRQLFEQFGDFNLRYRVAADHDLNIRFFCNPNVKKKYLSIPIAYYHTSGFSANQFDLQFWEDWDNTILKPFKNLLSLKKVYGTLGVYIRFLISQKRYSKALKLMAKNFFHTGSLGFLRLSLKNLLIEKVNSFKKYKF